MSEENPAAETSAFTREEASSQRGPVSLVPILLGAGSRLFENLGDDPPTLEQLSVVEAPGVTHLTYRPIR